MFFLISQINNEIVKIFMIIFSDLIIFYSLGKVFHKYFKFETTNTFFQISTGAFIFYILLFTFQYFLMSFNVEISVLLLFEKIIRMFILIFILITIKIWFNFSSFLDSKKIFSFILYVVFFIILIYLFYSLQNIYPSFNNFYNDEKYLSILDMNLKSNVNEFMNNSLNFNYSIDKYYKFQYYYFNPMIKMELYSFNSLSFTIKYLTPSILFLIINSMFFSISFLRYDSKNLFSLLFLTLIFYVFYFLAFFKINIFNQFLIPILVFLMLIVSIFKLSENFYFDRKYLLIPILSTILFLSSTYYSIFLMFAIMIICTNVLEKNGEDKIYAFAFFFNLFIFEILIITLNETLIQNTIFWFVFFIPILLINYQVIRKDFFKNNKKTKEKNKSRKTITSILYGVAFIVFFIFLMLNSETRKSFIDMFTFSHNTIYRTLYFLIYYPLMFVFILYWLYKKNIMKTSSVNIFLNSIVLNFILLFNPISVTIFLSILNLPLMHFGLVSTSIMILFVVMNYIINKRWL